MHDHIRRSSWTFLLSIIFFIISAGIIAIPAIISNSVSVLFIPLTYIPLPGTPFNDLPITYALIALLVLVLAVILFFIELRLKQSTVIKILDKEIIILKNGSIKGQFTAKDIITTDFSQGFFGRLTNTAHLTILATVTGKNGTKKQKLFRIGRVKDASSSFISLTNFRGSKPSSRSANIQLKKTRKTTLTNTKSSSRSSSEEKTSRKTRSSSSQKEQSLQNTFDYPKMTGSVKLKKNAKKGKVDKPLTKKETIARAEYLERTTGSEKGAEFEDEVDDLLRTRDAFPTHHQALKNLFVPYGDGSGRLSEIDNVAISETGIYVFECKNYNGTVFGKKDARNWTVVYDSGETRNFYSPVLQNDGHIRTLSELLNLPRDAFKSIIVFSDQSNLNGVSFDRDHICVTSISDLAKELRFQIRKDKKIFSTKEVDRIFADMVPYTEATFEDRLKHLNQVQKAAEENS